MEISGMIVELHLDSVAAAVVIVGTVQWLV